MTIIAHTLGVGDEDLVRVKRWSDDLVMPVGNSAPSVEQTRGYLVSTRDFSEYFAADPDLQTRVRADRSLVDGVVDEALRFEAPVGGLFRQALADVDVDGVTISAGELDRMGDIELADGNTFPFADTYVLRGLQRLDVTFTTTHPVATHPVANALRSSGRRSVLRAVGDGDFEVDPIPVAHHGDGR